MGRGFERLGWLEKEKGQIQARGPGLGPRWSPWVSLLHTLPSSLPPRPWGLTPPSLLWSHQFSDRTPHQPLCSQASPPFSPGPSFPLLQPHSGCSVPLPFHNLTGKWVLVSRAHPGPRWSLGIIQEMSFLSTAHSLPEGSCLQGLHLCPLHPNHSFPAPNPPRGGWLQQRGRPWGLHLSRLCDPERDARQLPAFISICNYIFLVKAAIIILDLLHRLLCV